jgi:uncharacterized protein (TIGR03000 family)
MRSRAFWLALVMCACIPGAARAQLPGDPPAPVYGSRVLPPYPSAGGPYDRYSYGRFREPMAPPGFAAFPFFYVPRGFWPNGLSLYGAPVPTPGALPGVFGNYDLVRQWRAFPLYGIGAYGTLGLYAPGPRVRGAYGPPVYGPPLPVVEGLRGPAAPPAGAKVAGAVILSVRVPQPAAEVLVNGKKTTQTGTDRIFESPPLDAAETYTYVVTARWIERGQVVEVSRQVKGTPGEVVRVDFGR